MSMLSWRTQHVLKHVDYNNVNILKRLITTQAKAPSRGLVKMSLLGIGIGAVVGTGYSFHQLNKPTTHILNQQTSMSVLKNVPNIVPTRKIRFVGDTTNLKLTLFQYQTCPFCCKVRAFLDYNGISYDVVEVDPVLRQAIKWSTYKKVPILLAKVPGGYQPMNDSSMIISALSSFLIDNCRLSDVVKYYPLISFVDDKGSTKTDVMNKYFLMFEEGTPTKTKEYLDDERKWRQWIDEVFVHVLSPNVYRTFNEALQAFDWFSQTGDWDKHFPLWERYLMVYVGSVAMWLIGKRLKSRHNLHDDVRQSLYQEANYWVKAVELKGTPFLGGSEPNLADISMYGVLNSIEGCYAFQELLEKSKIRHWYFAMRNSIRHNVQNVNEN